MTKDTSNPNATPRLRGFVDKMPLDPKRPRHFAILSFLECTIIPMPIEVITAPFMAAYPRRAIRMASAMWIACIIGSILFYALGFLLFEPIVEPALYALGLDAQFHEIHNRFSTNGLFWTVITIGLLPMPLQFASLGAGLMQGNILIFFAALAAARGVRYFGLALLCRWAGPTVERVLISKGFGVFAAALLIIAGGALVWFLWPTVVAAGQ